MSPDSNNRFISWCALAVSSSVALIAHTTTDYDYVDSDMEGYRYGSSHKWVTSVCAISLGISLCTIMIHFVPSFNFVGGLGERVVALFLTICWVTGLPVILNPDNDIAANEFGTRNDDLYFSSWAAFSTAFYIAISLVAKAVVGVSTVPRKTWLWVTLFVASVVVMVASSRDFKCFCDGFNSNECERIVFGVSLGAVGTVFALAMSLLTLKDRIDLIGESIMSVLLLVMYSFGVGFITFEPLGNLYFATWGGFIVAMLLTAGCVEQRFFSDDDSESTAHLKTDPESQRVEDIPKA